MLRNAKSLPDQCRTCLARRDGLCSDIAGADFSLLQRRRSGDRRFKPEQEILPIGQPCDSIYNLTSGWAFRYALLEDGRRQILDFILPGAVIGFQSVAGARASYGVQALTEATVCAIRHSALIELCRQLPDLGLRLAWLTARDRSLAYDHLTSVGRHSAHQRVAHLILELFVRCRAQWPGEQINDMHLPLTQEHVGDSVGLSSVHVNRVLRDLRSEGIVELHYRRLSILNPDKLMEVAETDPDLLVNWMNSCRQTDDPGDSIAGGCNATLQKDQAGANRALSIAHETKRSPAVI